MTTTAAAPAGTRLAWLDRMRGLAIVVMVASHTIMLTTGTRVLVHEVMATPARLTFLLLLGLLFRPGLRHRHARMAAGAVIAQALALYLGFAVPNILTVMVAAILVMQLLHRYPTVAIGLGLTQAMWWPHPGTGVQLGLAVAAISAGTLLRETQGLNGSEFARAGRYLPAFLEPIGRAPLEWYVGHLIALSAVVWVLT